MMSWSQAGGRPGAQGDVGLTWEHRGDLQEKRRENVWSRGQMEAGVGGGSLWESSLPASVSSRSRRVIGVEEKEGVRPASTMR